MIDLRLPKAKDYAINNEMSFITFRGTGMVFVVGTPMLK